MIMSLTALGSEQIARKLYRYDRVCAPVPHPEAFSDEHVRQFHDEGYIAVENVFSDREVEDAKAALRFLIDGGNPAYDGAQLEDAAIGKNLTAEEKESYVRKVMSFVDYDARLKQMCEHPALMAIVERLMGSKMTMIQDMALMKPPYVGREKPWHQDNAYFLYEPIEGVLGTWTALDAATAQNGCMHVIPRTHQLGPRPHYHDRDCQLPDDQIDIDRDVMVPLRPGGTLFFSSLLHHGTPPNTSAARRRALQFHYARVDCRKITSQRHAEIFHDRLGSAGCTGWTPQGKAGRPISQRES
jgi:phytanoyl-CoA hydroxylase